VRGWRGPRELAIAFEFYHSLMQSRKRLFLIAGILIAAIPLQPNGKVDALIDRRNNEDIVWTRVQ
jgi:hypothetical protein